ncbi:MAG TPA: FG-GAP-like repeat-containing protein [Pyrinomonadaceae bacterium]|jgi:uncharacterized delta-60 repeat protein
MKNSLFGFLCFLIFALDAFAARGLDSTFNASVTEGFGYANHTLTQPDGKILAYGYFQRANGARFNHIARFNAGGTLDATFNSGGSGANSVVYEAVLLPDNKIIIGGNFTSFNGTAVNRLARLNADGTLDTSFNAAPSFTNLIEEIFLQPDGKIIVVATAAGSPPSSRIFRLNANGSLDGAFQNNLPVNGSVNSVALTAEGKILVGGEFSNIGGATKYYLARLNANGTLDDTFSSTLPGSVNKILILPDGKLFIAGVSEDGYKLLNADGSPAAADFENAVPSVFIFAGLDAARQPDGKILLVFGRGFSGTVTDYTVIRYNADLTLDETFQSVAFEYRSITDLNLLANGKFIISGEFVALNNQPRLHIARLNTDGTVDPTFAAQISAVGTVRAIKRQPDGKILIGGIFEYVNGVRRTNVARLNTDGSVDNTFNAPVELFKEVPTDVYDLDLQSDGKIILGRFMFYGGNLQFSDRLGFSNQGGVARLNPDGTFDATFNNGAGAAGVVFALERQSDGKTLVGGQFLDFNGAEKFSLVRLQNAGALPPFDFDGDAKSDISIFRSSVGEWWYQRSSDGQVPAVQFGASSDKPVPADFTGDGKTDIAVWRSSTGEWFILRSENGSYYSLPFGQTGDLPAPADYDGDGRADLAVFRPSNGEWFINKSAGGIEILRFGQAGDVPVTGDYDADGRADIAVFRPASGQWWLARSSTGIVAATFGNSGDKPVPGDWTGDGKTDLAFYRPATGEWFFLRSEDNSFYSVPFGASGDVPAPGDYDGDGRLDTAVFRPPGATWYVNRSTAGLLIQQFGLSTDTPVPSVFVP